MDANPIVCPANGIKFPEIYRVMIRDESQHGAPLVRIGYTLDPDVYWSVGSPREFVAISKPDPAFERGWLVVRHHRAVTLATGYLNALQDLDRAVEGYLHGIPLTVFEADGHFTLIHRPAIYGRRDPALIFITEVPAPAPATGWMDEQCAIDKEGNELDADDLFDDAEVTH